MLILFYILQALPLNPHCFYVHIARDNITPPFHGGYNNSTRHSKQGSVHQAEIDGKQMAGGAQSSCCRVSTSLNTCTRYTFIHSHPEKTQIPPRTSYQPFPWSIILFIITIVTRSEKKKKKKRNTQNENPLFMPSPLSCKHLDNAVASSANHPFAVLTPYTRANPLSPHYPMACDFLNT